MGEAMEADDSNLLEKLARLGEKVDTAITKFQETRPQEPEVAQSRSSGNETRIVFGEGGKSVVTSLMVGLVAGVCLGLSVAVVGWVSWALNRQDSMNNWTAHEVTAIRSYITNGKLQPMNPRPFGPEEEKKKP